MSEAEVRAAVDSARCCKASLGGVAAPPAPQPDVRVLDTLLDGAEERLRSVDSAVVEYTEEDFEVTFRKTGGTVLNMKTGQTFDFVKASGVYFIKMRVPKALLPNDPSKPVFGRPGDA